MMANQELKHQTEESVIPTPFDKSEEIMKKVTDALQESNGELTESEIWEMLVSDQSESWREASRILQEREADLENRLSPDNIPLGLIGAALDAGALDASRSMHTQALASFTVINETLRQQPGLQGAMKSLLRIRDRLQLSQQLTRQAIRLTQQFAAAQAHHHYEHQQEMREPKKTRGLLSIIFAVASHGQEPAKPAFKPEFTGPEPAAQDPSMAENVVQQVIKPKVRGLTA